MSGAASLETCFLRLVKNYLIGSVVSDFLKIIVRPASWLNTEGHSYGEDIHIPSLLVTSKAQRHFGD